MAASKVSIRLYPSGSGVVLIGIDWTPPKTQPTSQPFFGFAIRRTPGFHEPLPVGGRAVQANFSWLENRLSFDGPADLFRPSNIAPIQKFQWWDARFHPDEDAGRVFTYEVMPMTGRPDALVPFPGATATAKVTFPDRYAGGVGVFFNRPFVSSQAFSRLLQRLKVDPDDPTTLTPKAKTEIYAWLGNGLETMVPNFVAATKGSDLAGAIYHLTDGPTIAALAKRRGTLVMHWDDPNAAGKGGDTTNLGAEGALQKAKWQLTRRKRGNLMHDKILVESKGASSKRVLMGSANFTLEGLTTQANVLHDWRSPKLAALYGKRVQALTSDPKPSTLTATATWSPPVALGGGATASVIFSPEADRSTTVGWAPVTIKPIVEAITHAQSSILFCLYDPTDAALLDAVLDAVDRSKAAFGLINTLPTRDPSPTTKDGKPTPGYAIKKRLFDFTRTHNEIVSAQGFFSPLTALPPGWLRELNALPATKKQTDGDFDFSSIHVHHKFVLIDGETAKPILFTGSANLSKNSSTKNDENTLRIDRDTTLAQTYLAEFMRLYEHYRSRPTKRAGRGTDDAGIPTRPALRLDETGASWWKKYFVVPSPSATARKSFGR